MALYPYSVADSIPQGIQPLAPGTAICIPVDLSPGGSLSIDLVQATHDAVQDFTLRTWISSTPLGNPDQSLPPVLQAWQANKTPGVLVYHLYDRSIDAPQSVFKIPADPGQFYLNIVNLTNQPNQFWLTVAGSAATSGSDTW